MRQLEAVLLVDIISRPVAIAADRLDRSPDCHKAVNHPVSGMGKPDEELLAPGDVMIAALDYCDNRRKCQPFGSVSFLVFRA